MTQEDINLLTLTTYHLIISNATGRPYIDQNFGCYMFELKSDAEAFCREIQNTHADEPKNYQQIIFCTEFFFYGIKEINVKKRAKDIVKIAVKKEDTRKQYYNELANGLLLRLKQTSEKQYLRGLKDINFLVPVLIDVRYPKGYPKLHYSYAEFPGDRKYYVLFSTLQEYDNWNKSQENKWKPMEMSLSKFGRIRKNTPVFINPLNDKIILTDKQIKKALEEIT